MEDVPLFQVGIYIAELSSENPRNYSLARKCIVVDYKTLAADYSPKAVLQKGRGLSTLSKQRQGLASTKATLKASRVHFALLNKTGVITMLQSRIVSPCRI